MAIEIRARPSKLLDLMLAATSLALVLFGALAVSQRDWVAGGFALVSLAGLVRLGTLRVRLRRARIPAPSPVGPHRTPGDIIDAGGVFTSPARHMIGARYRDGYVVIASDVAGFVPTSPWRHLAVQIVAELIVTTVPTTRIELAATAGPELARELAALVSRTGGLVLDHRWSWARRGSALARPAGKDYLTITNPPPAEHAARWAELPAAPASQVRRTQVRIVVGAAVVVGVLGGGGVVAWRATGDSDFLVAGLSFAGLIGGSVITGLVFASRIAAARSRGAPGEEPRRR